MKFDLTINVTTIMALIAGLVAVGAVTIQQQQTSARLSQIETKLGKIEANSTANRNILERRR